MLLATADLLRPLESPSAIMDHDLGSVLSSSSEISCHRIYLTSFSRNFMLYNLTSTFQNLNYDSAFVVKEEQALDLAFPS